MLKKILAAVLAAAACVTCFVGCGGGGNTGTSVSTNEESKTGSSGKTGDLPTVKIAVVGSEDEVSIIDKLIAGYKSQEGNGDKKIEKIRISGSLDNYYNTHSRTGSLPDMIQVYDYSSEYWTYKNMYRSVSDLMQRDGFDTSAYFDSSMKIAQSGQEGDDDYYWMPRDYNKVVICYNKDIFDFANIEAPQDDWTMEDFDEACRQLKAKTKEIEKKFKVDDFYPAQMQTEWYAVYYPFIKTYGGELFDLESGTAFQNYDKVTAALDTLLAYSDNEYTLSPDMSDIDAFASKQAAMVFTSRPNIQSYAEYLKGYNIDFASMPTITGIEGGATSYIGMGCTGYAITTSCSDEKLDIAWDFLKYIVSEAGQEVFGATGSGVPVLKSLANDENAEWRQFISADLNHEAFVKYPERDLPMNFLRGVKVAKQTEINAQLASMMNGLYTTLPGDRATEYQNLKAKLEGLLNS